MRKIHVLIILLLTIQVVESQNARRFYNSLELIFLSPDDDKKIPNSLDFLSEWCLQTVDNIYFSNLQRNINSRNSASFNSLDLIPRRTYDFDFLDTGFLISFNKKIQKRETKVNVVNNNVWRIKSYNAIIDLDTFNPENMTNNFYYMKILGSISDESMLAHFINQTNSYKNYNDSITITKRFIKTLNQKQGLTIDENLDKSKDFRLSQLCDAINNQVKNSNCTFPAYLSYIKKDQREQTLAAINTFYYPLLSRTLQDVMDRELLPEGDYTFNDKNVTLALPSKYFKPLNTKTPIEFEIKKIEYDLNYDFDKKDYYINIKLSSHKNTMTDDFKVKVISNNILKNKIEHKKTEFKKEEFKGLLFKIYPDVMSVVLILDGGLYDTEFRNLKLSQTFKIN